MPAPILSSQAFECLSGSLDPRYVSQSLSDIPPPIGEVVTFCIKVSGNAFSTTSLKILAFLVHGRRGIEGRVMRSLECLAQCSQPSLMS